LFSISEKIIDNIDIASFFKKKLRPIVEIIFFNKKSLRNNSDLKKIDFNTCSYFNKVFSNATLMFIKNRLLKNEHTKTIKLKTFKNYKNMNFILLWK